MQPRRRSFAVAHNCQFGAAVGTNCNRRHTSGRPRRRGAGERRARDVERWADHGRGPEAALAPKRLRSARAIARPRRTRSSCSKRWCASTCWSHEARAPRLCDAPAVIEAAQAPRDRGDVRARLQVDAGSRSRRPKSSQLLEGARAPTLRRPLVRRASQIALATEAEAKALIARARRARRASLRQARGGAQPRQAHAPPGRRARLLRQRAAEPTPAAQRTASRRSSSQSGVRAAAKEGEIAQAADRARGRLQRADVHRRDAGASSAALGDRRAGIRDRARGEALHAQLQEELVDQLRAEHKPEVKPELVDAIVLDPAQRCRPSRRAFPRRRPIRAQPPKVGRSRDELSERMTADEEPDAKPADAAQAVHELARAHLRFGWIALLVFATLGRGARGAARVEERRVSRRRATRCGA